MRHITPLLAVAGSVGLLAAGQANANCKWFEVCGFPPKILVNVDVISGDPSCLTVNSVFSLTDADGCLRFQLCTVPLLCAGCPEQVYVAINVVNFAPKVVTFRCGLCGVFPSFTPYPTVDGCIANICTAGGETPATAIDVTACAQPDCNGNGIPDKFDPDADGDGVPDDCDVCPGFPDHIDTDLDGVPDGCDVCPLFDDNIDTDGDGVPDGCDACPGFDDNLDIDGNGVPDGCELCAGGNCCVAQSLDDTDAQTQVTCIAAFPNFGSIPTGFARCFDLATKGVPEDFVVDSVTFGVSFLESFGGDFVLPLIVNVYSTPECPPSLSTAKLLAAEPVLIFETTCESREICHFRKITVQFSNPPTIPGSSAFVVEVFDPVNGAVPEDDPNQHWFIPWANASPASADALIRTIAEVAGECDLPDWVPVTNLGFSTSQTVIIVSGHTAAGTPVVCGDGEIAGCEECDDGNDIPGDGCDANCQFDPCQDNAACEDNNLCTDDICDGSGNCVYLPNYELGVECCNPATGTATMIDDGDNCTVDTCDPATGQVIHTPVVCPKGQVCDPATGRCVPACSWDLDGSSDVGVNDLLLLLGAWGDCPPKGDCLADFDNTGDVGVNDLLVLLGNWGPCP